MQLALIYGENIIETDSQVPDGDFHFAQVLILPPPLNTPQYRVALVHE
jgi:hypothetical protein